MSEYLAPNGKPSKLTPEQYRLVRTKAFKDWFGDWENDPENSSKVIDEETKEPLVVYHGAEIPNKIEKGRFNLFNKGSYFTDTYESAKYYAFKLAYGIDDVKEEDTEIYEVFLNIKNPKTFDYQNEDAEDYFHDFYEEDKRIKNYSDEGYDGLFWEYSFKMYNTTIKEKEKHFITFQPTQIKLADGTNTTFDGKNPDIRFDGGGEISFNDNRVFFNGEDIGLFEYDINGNEIEINRIYLDNTKQKQGFGRKIIKNLFESYNNVDKIVLYPSPSSEPFWIRITENVRKDGYFEITRNSFEIGDKKYFRFKKGGRTIAQTPAPKKERIYGSEKNKPESSKDIKSAEKIEFNEKTLETIKNKVAEHNKKNPKKKVNLASAKAVVRRGMGAYSSTHRPTISGGKPNSRVAWGLARLNAFFYKIINGKSKSGKYNQDDDLINELGYKVKKYADGGEISINMRNEIIDILSKNARYGKQILSVQEVGIEVIQSCIESNTYFGNVIRQANENYIMIPVSYEDKLWAVDKKVGYIYFAKPNENTKIRVEYKYDMQDYPVPILFDSEIKNNQEFYDVNDYDEIKSSKFDSEFLYRGINNDEMLSIIENGFIKSNAFLNIGKQQEETTSFAQHISQASAYAVGFNAWFDEVTFAKPKYILKVKKEGVNYKPTIETDIENEVDVFGEIPIQQIESIYEFRLGECQMGQVEINVGYNNDFSDGSRSPMFKKVFVRKTDINSIIERNKIQKSDGGDIQAYEESMGISEFDEGGESGGDVNYKNQPRDLSQIENYENIYKGAEFYSFSDSSEKQEKSDRWFELFRINQKERQLTTSEFIEFMQLSNELSWEEFADGGQIEIPSEFWGNEAGGVLIYCRKTKRYLLLERSKYVNEPNTWNLISGKIEEHESVKEAVIRECFEEIGFHISDLIPIYKYETDDFIFHNFLSVVDDEFHVDFNWESSDYGWFHLKDFPKKLHFGLKILLESVNLIDIVNSNKEYYQQRNIGGGLEYYKRKGIEHWVFTTKEDFEKNAQEDNTIEF